MGYIRFAESILNQTMRELLWEKINAIK